MRIRPVATRFFDKRHKPMVGDKLEVALLRTFILRQFVMGSYMSRKKMGEFLDTPLPMLNNLLKYRRAISDSRWGKIYPKIWAMQQRNFLRTEIKRGEREAQHQRILSGKWP